MSKNTRTRILLTAVAALLLLAVTVGGTMAYLQAKTTELKNTFTPSNLSIELDETKPTNNTAQMIPGATIEKDPDVTYTTDVPAYVFVKVTKSDNYDDYFVDYSVAEGWTILNEDTMKNDDGIYETVAVFYKEVATGATDVAILNPEYVTVKTDVEKADMALLYNTDGTVNTAACPTLSFQAYIIQKQNGSDDNGAATYFTPADAYTQALTTAD